MSTIRLQIRRRRFEIALEDVIRNANPQWDAANWELLTRSITSGARGDISDVLGILILSRAVRIDVRGHEDIFGGKGVEAPMDSQEDTAEGCVEHGVPDAGEVARDKGADVAKLVGDRFGWDVVVLEVTADAIEFVGDEVKGYIVGGVICERKIITSLVVQAENLESSAGEGGVARGVRWKWGFEVGMVAVGVRGTFCKPERILRGSRIETDAGQGTPELEAVFFLPSVDSCVRHCRVEEGKYTDEIRVGGFVCRSC